PENWRDSWRIIDGLAKGDHFDLTVAFGRHLAKRHETLCARRYREAVSFTVIPPQRPRDGGEEPGLARPAKPTSPYCCSEGPAATVKLFCEEGRRLSATGSESRVA